MNLEQALALLGMMTDTVSQQQVQINALTAEVTRLHGLIPDESPSPEEKIV